MENKKRTYQVINEAHAYDIKPVKKAINGLVKQSCGNFSNKTGMFRKIGGLKMMETVFTAETDPATGNETAGRYLFTVSAGAERSL